MDCSLGRLHDLLRGVTFMGASIAVCMRKLSHGIFVGDAPNGAATRGERAVQ